MYKIGVLALQGSVIEHVKVLSKLEEVIPCEVRTVDDLKSVSGLILPGGESTTIGKLIKDFNLYEPLVNSVKEGLPVWGTCAGMILLAKEIVDEDYVHLGTMDISVRRNAYGSQLDSFTYETSIPKVSADIMHLVFIRAPLIEKAGADVDILAAFNGKAIAARQGNMLATSFHPELTNNLDFHRYFIELVKNR